MDQSQPVQIFDFQGHELRVEMIDGEPWFVAGDACQMLDIKNVSDAVEKLDEDEKDNIALTDAIGRQHSMICVSLPGLQKLIFTSRKPEANKITRWVTHDVLPSIYRTGSYVVPGAVGQYCPQPISEHHYQAELISYRLEWRDHILARLLNNEWPDRPEWLKARGRRYVDLHYIFAGRERKQKSAISVIARNQVLAELQVEGIIEESPHCHSQYRLVASTAAEQEAAVKRGILLNYCEEALLSEGQAALLE